MERLEVLELRRERLIKINRFHGYTNSHPNKKKTNQYLGLLLEIRKQKNQIHINRRENKNYSKNLNKAVSNISNALTSSIQLKSLTPVI